MKKPSLYEFIDDKSSFRVIQPDRISSLYFPLANDCGLLSAITPDLAGDIKIDQHSFLTPPVSVEDLHTNRAARNFWVSIAKKGAGKRREKLHWAANGRSVDQRASSAPKETVTLEAGLLWHRMKRANKELGLEATVLSFVPVVPDTFEVLFVEIKNTGKKPLQFTATSAIPLFGRSADNLRDHRHVTSLLHRLSREKNGLRLCPTMSFNERGHSVNTTSYYVVGVDAEGQPPIGLYPTVQSFIGEGGDLERPAALFEGRAPRTDIRSEDQGKEAIGALQFRAVKLNPGESTFYTLLLGITPRDRSLDGLLRAYDSRQKIDASLRESEAYWHRQIETIVFKTGDSFFNRWIRWVQVQPTLRRIFGCSFLPDFDYGRGGRGWRDLWQDCLALLLANPADVREDMLRNFGGVRIDGSNATIVVRKRVEKTVDSGLNREAQEYGFAKKEVQWKAEFVADRNNITRTWMDHGIWPFLTSQLYINQTGDFAFLLEKVPYFRDAQLNRGQKLDQAWLESTASGSDSSEDRCKLKTSSQKVYEGAVLEHILVQLLVQFFNVGEHNNVRLEDADWNDGLDMAGNKGESVTFTAMYGGCLESLAELLEMCEKKASWQEVNVAEELLLLLDHIGTRVNYDSVEEKRARLDSYFKETAHGVKGKQASFPVSLLIQDLKEKADWIRQHINRQEWVEESGFAWFNGYYDDNARRVEGRDQQGRVRMTLTGQVFPVMAGVAGRDSIGRITKAVDAFLFDKELGGFRLNTNFGGDQFDLGRAFSFVYGEKENGAVFSHMVVMYAYALYKRGFAKEGHRAINSLYQMATRTDFSKIYPGLPEYFNKEGRGRYMYLTGSASWYVLTILTQVFGVRGEGGDLLLSPKLDPGQFDRKKEASVEIVFAGTRLKVVYRNPLGLSYEDWRIGSVRSREAAVPFTRRTPREILIQREIVVQQREWEIAVSLEKAEDR